MFFSDPGPCPICGTAHTACTGATDESTGVGTTRGVIVRVDAPLAALPQVERVEGDQAGPVSSTSQASSPTAPPATRAASLLDRRPRRRESATR